MKTSFIKSLEHAIKHLFFTATQVGLKKGRTTYKSIDPTAIKRILFIRPDKLGDMVVSLPVFYNVKKAYPHLQLYLISSPRNINIVRDNEYLTKIFVYTKKVFRDIVMVREIRRLGIDAVVDMVSGDSVTALFLTQFCSARAWRIGRNKQKHGGYYDFNYLLGSDESGHAVDGTLSLLTAFGIDVNETEAQVPPTINAEYSKAARKYLNSLNGDAPGGIIGLNISAGRPTRVWPQEKNLELIRCLLEKYQKHRIIISSDPSDRLKAVNLSQEFPARVDTLPEGMNLLEVSAVIGHMKILITPDTSLVHIARSFKVPVVGLYTRYKKNLRMWRPYRQKSGTVVSNNDYNIHDIEIDRVFEAVVSLLPPGDC